MKELIGKLSRGSIEYNIPAIDTSITALETSVVEKGKLEGNIEVYTDEEYQIKGVVYSSCDAVSVEPAQFIGKKINLKYSVDAMGYEPGMEINGRINIVSNCGELFIPYNIKIVEKSVDSSEGKISNLFHFVNLVKNNYEEAFKLFYKSEFSEVFLAGDVAAESMYEGLIKGTDKRLALEEFVIGINKKQGVKICISDSEKVYQGIIANCSDKIILTRSGWGYQNIEIEVDGEFITECKPNITDENFVGNTYEFEYVIDAGKLHGGMNFGAIRFKDLYETNVCRITVENVKDFDRENREIQKCQSLLMEKYLEFRMKKISVDAWAKMSFELIERGRSFKDSLFLKLLQAQICLSRRKDGEAKGILDGVSEEAMNVRETNVQLYCYYLYVRSLQKREIEYTQSALGIIKGYYENGFDDWRLLWLLLYMDINFENNKSLKLARIKEQYKVGCRSPLMYYEALYVLNRQPGFLRMINDFELQVLNFGNKYDGIELRLAIQISELAMFEKKFRPLFFDVLAGLYEKFENKTILEALLSLLIRCNKADKKYFKWFALGVEIDIQVTKLYEYYVMSMPGDFMDKIPDNVLMYFLHNPEALNDKASFFYSRIIRNKEDNLSVYENYKAVMEKYAVNRLREGVIDEYMSTLYRDLIIPEMITEENEKALIRVLNTWKLRCRNKDIKSVIVIHKELEEEKGYGLNALKTYIRMFTEDAVVLFEDYKGRRWLDSVEYSIEKVFDSKELQDECYKRNSDDNYIKAQICENSIRYHKSVPECRHILREIMVDDAFKGNYRNYITRDIVEYYLNSLEDEALDNYIKNMDVSILSCEMRNSILEVMITRGLYIEADTILRKYGICNLEPGKMMKFCSRNVNKYEEIQDKQMLRYCEYEFLHGKFSEATLNYLARYYNGTTRDMVEIWRVSKEFECENRDLEERIIAQMLFTRTHTGNLAVIYESYSKKTALEMVKNAYLFYMSHEYFTKEKPVDDLYFTHLEKELMSNKNLMDICKVAYLAYNSKKTKLSPECVALCKECLEYLESKKIIFDFYKEYSKWFAVSDSVMDKSTIVYRTEPVDRVYINYEIRSKKEEVEYKNELMDAVFPGVYTKTFTLFYGEKLSYYIVAESEEGAEPLESCNYAMDDRDVEYDDTRYGQINCILSYIDVRDENMTKESALDFYKEKKMTETIF